MKKSLLGDVPLHHSPASFNSLFKTFESPSFSQLPHPKKSETVNRLLLQWVLNQKTPCFLLADVLFFIQKVTEKKWLQPYSFSHFELWLNQHSGLSGDENSQVRGKIAGKWIDRSDYQVLFPIGMGKVFEGTHFVTAHKSPDLDTTVASFWGWLDAFAARVSDGLHIWNLPGGPPLSQIEIQWLFRDCFGEGIFSHLPQTRTALHITAYDLMNQKGVLQKTPRDSMAYIDHEWDQNTVVVTDPEGSYLGDWRAADVEGVKQLIFLLNSCWQWFENQLSLELFSLFARPHLSQQEIAKLLKPWFALSLEQSEPSKKFSRNQQKHMEAFLIQLLGAPQGLKTSFQELAKILGRLSHTHLEGLEHLDAWMKTMHPLFDAKGKWIDKREKIFEFLEKTLKDLHEWIFVVHSHLETLEMALKIKHQVFGHHPHFVTTRSELEEIQSKMASHVALTVVHLDQGKNFPLGVILASQLKKQALATVSLRDFCNREEMTIPPTIEVISVIDHHKSTLSTFSPPLAIISDAQSSNSLVARAAFEINDRFKRRKKSAHFIDRTREFLEYLHFLYAILDDTDLLSKVSPIDLECMASLLNRMKSLQMGQEIQIVHLDEMPKDKSYLKKAAKLLLQNEELYSLYRKVYAFREQEVEQNILLASQGKSSHFFDDTKEQNGCCRVGQTKVFTKNIPSLHMHLRAIRSVWIENAKKVASTNKELQLHLHMISTIVNAEEVYKGVEEKHTHKDEMWIWVPFVEGGIEKLKRFLNLFQASLGLKDNPLEVTFSGPHAKEFKEVFTESFLEIPQTVSTEPLDMAVLRFKAGSMNSRKAVVTPFLPNIE